MENRNTQPLQIRSHSFPNKVHYIHRHLYMQVFRNLSTHTLPVGVFEVLKRASNTPRISIQGTSHDVLMGIIPAVLETPCAESTATTTTRDGKTTFKV